MLPSRTVYPLTREMYLAGCELHIQTLTFLVLTLKQYVNAKTTWGSEVRNINRNDDYCQPLMTNAASIQLILEVEAGKRLVLDPSLHFTPDLQSSVCILPSVCISTLVCSLQSLYFKKNKICKGKTFTFTKLYCFKSGEILASSICPTNPRQKYTVVVCRYL